MENGRINNLPNFSVIYENSRKVPSKTFNDEATRGIHEFNKTSQYFFSEKNIDNLQEAIRYLVYKSTCKKYIIDRQSDTELKLIMRAIYLENPSPYDQTIKENVKNLNTLTLNYCVPRIIQEIKQYLYYKNDITNMPTPLKNSEFSATKGTKVLEVKSFF